MRVPGFGTMRWLPRQVFLTFLCKTPVDTPRGMRETAHRTGAMVAAGEEHDMTRPILTLAAKPWWNGTFVDNMAVTAKLHNENRWARTTRYIDRSVHRGDQTWQAPVATTERPRPDYPGGTLFREGWFERPWVYVG